MHYIGILIPLLCPRINMTFSCVILEKCCYSCTETELHTLSSCTLDCVQSYVHNMGFCSITQPSFIYISPVLYLLKLYNSLKLFITIAIFYAHWSCIIYCSIGSPQRRGVDPLVVSVSVGGVFIAVVLLGVLVAAVILAKIRSGKRGVLV